MDAERALRSGDLQQGMVLATNAYETSDRLPVSQRSEALLLQRLIAAFQAGQLDDLMTGLGDAEGQVFSVTGNTLLPAASLAATAQLGLLRDTRPLQSVVTRVRKTRRSWLDSPTLYLLGRAAVLTGLSDPGLESRLETHSGCWVLLGTGVATAGPVDTVLAAFAELRGDHERASALAARARALCGKMAAPFWITDTDLLIDAARSFGRET